MENFTSVDSFVVSTRPNLPVYCLRPHVVARTTAWFLENFPGTVMYSVKSNPDLTILKSLHKGGIKHFDTASLPEIRLVRKHFPTAKMYFMHTVKSREAIRAAYFEFGIRDFSLDSVQELKKIQEETDYAKDLNLHVRLAVPNEYAEVDLSQKFGVAFKEAPFLLKEVRKAAAKLGICFHVGSQCMHPIAYYNAIEHVLNLLKRTKISIDSLDVGGGFPSVYPGMVPARLERYMEEIMAGVRTLPNHENIQLFCEPGRALVAEAGSMLVRVELRKGNMLHINDGVYGGLFDAGMPKFIYPTRTIRLAGVTSENLQPFGFYGPTCDSIDTMRGPFYLPEDIDEGDYIEIGQLGAYSRTMMTNFNGFASDQAITTQDEPLMSIFDLPQEHHAVAKESA